MRTLLALDPSVTATGWAFFEDGKVKDAGVLSRVDEFRGTELQVFRTTRPDILVVEIPQVYGRNSMVDENDLIAVAVTAGVFIGSIICKELVTVRPAKWKGQVPKSIHNERVLAKLSADERDLLLDIPKSKLHNAIDAIGIGLWHLGR